jgi:glycine/D-amino acid oxidase-like deaminating enzyme
MDDPSFYGFPVWPGAALKAAQDVGGNQVTATTRGFDPDPAATDRLAGFLRTRLPTAAGPHDHTATCLYTLTPDRDFALGPLPGHDRVLVALGAAHGFKFAPSSAGSSPTSPCTTAPRWTSPRSPSTARPSPPPSRRPTTWSERRWPL